MQADLAEGNLKFVERFRSHRRELVGTCVRRAFFNLLARELECASRQAEVRDWYAANQEISMWGRDQLCSATILSALARGPILEIGSYIGGSAVAFGRGAKVSNADIISVEKGGTHVGHHLATDDILTEWRKNIERFGVADRLHLVEGNYGEQLVQEKVRDAVSQCRETVRFRHKPENPPAHGQPMTGPGLGMLCIDADGHADRAFNAFAKYLKEGSILMIDDYESSVHEDKAPLTAPSVDRLCELGFLNSWGTIHGQTWIGTAGKVRSFVEMSCFVSRLFSRIEDDHARDGVYAARLPDRYFPYSDAQRGGSSPLLFFEENRILGPAHCNVEQVRKLGKGAYVHWNDMLYFSTCDGSDPRTNGRKYEVMLGDDRQVMLFA